MGHQREHAGCLISAFEVAQKRPPDPASAPCWPWPSRVSASKPSGFGGMSHWEHQPPRRRLGCVERATQAKDSGSAAAATGAPIFAMAGLMVRMAVRTGHTAIGEVVADHGLVRGDHTTATGAGTGGWSHGGCITTVCAVTPLNPALPVPPKPGGVLRRPCRGSTPMEATDQPACLPQRLTSGARTSSPRRPAPTNRTPGRAPRPAETCGLSRTAACFGLCCSGPREGPGHARKGVNR